MIAIRPIFSQAEGTESNSRPTSKKRSTSLPKQSGRGSTGLLGQDVVEGYFEELAQTRDTLSGRSDDLESGRVKPEPR